MAEVRDRGCPMCRRSLPPREDNPSYPFCSRRCQLLDLGKWLDGDYAVPDPDTAPPDAERN